MDGEHKAYTIYDNDQLTTAAEYQDIIVAYRNGAPVRVRDIGKAIDAPENARLAGLQNGKQGIQLVIFKQPSANIIDTVDQIKAALPRLVASIPASVHVDVVMDRTQTIRASVKDVQFTLMLSIALVVMVIFIFLRSVWATIIPSVTVPLALIGTFAVMYLFDYSLDNLSLMALTIAVGFVVDDAIVMLENIHRHIENGMKPMDAALKGAGEIGFTIISITASLIAVFIPLLLMGGIVGRLFREFAVTVTIAVVVSAVISLTLTPMMCSRFLRHHHGDHGRIYRIVESFFDGLVGFYRRTLDVALRFQFITLCVFVATVAATGYLFVVIPKGFFPEQDNGVIIGIAEGAQDISFVDMKKRVHGTRQGAARRPGRRRLLGVHRRRLRRADRATTRACSSHSSRARSASVGAADHRPAASASSRRIEGGQLFLQAGAGHPRRRPPRPSTQYQYTLQDADVGRALRLVAQGAGQAEHAAGAARRHHRPADAAAPRHADHRPRRRFPVRHLAGGRSTTPCTTRSGSARSPSTSPR